MAKFAGRFYHSYYTRADILMTNTQELFKGSPVSDLIHKNFLKVFLFLFSFFFLWISCYSQYGNSITMLCYYKKNIFLSDQKIKKNACISTHACCVSI